MIQAYSTPYSTQKWWSHMISSTDMMINGVVEELKGQSELEALVFLLTMWSSHFSFFTSSFSCDFWQHKIGPRTVMCAASWPIFTGHKSQRTRGLTWIAVFFPPKWTCSAHSWGSSRFPGFWSNHSGSGVSQFGSENWDPARCPFLFVEANDRLEILE